MNPSTLPSLSLSRWRPTRDTLHAYSRVLGRIRRSLAPVQKHWWHISLRVAPYGLSTSAIPVPGQDNVTFEMWMDLVAHQLFIRTSRGEGWSIELAGQSTAQFLDSCLSSLGRFEVHPEFDRNLFQDPDPREYDPAAATNFWKALARVDAVLKGLKSELPGETSPVQFWPHNFDLALMWLSGRKIPGQDPDDEERSDEQIAFGLSTGDAGTPDAYLYVTVYPWPEKLVDTPLPEDAVWHTQGWKGALLPYAALASSDNAEERLFDFFRTVYRSGSALLR